MGRSDGKTMISVIVAIYNIEHYLERCIESIAVQTYEELQIILVDDGSTDNSASICDTWGMRDKRIHVIHKENEGLSAARNCGIDRATGEYITFIDGDDYIHPQFIELLFQAAELAKADMAVCGFLRVTENHFNTVIERKIEKDSGITVYTGEEAFINRWTINVMAWNKLYKRKLFYSCRYPVGKLHEDEYMYHCLLFQCERVAYIKHSLYYYVCREDSIMKTFNLRRVECAKEALQERLEFCVKKQWGKTPYYAMEAICEYVTQWYCELKRIYCGNTVQSLRLYEWFKKIVKTYNDIEIAPKYRIFLKNPLLYEYYIKLKKSILSRRG